MVLLLEFEDFKIFYKILFVIYLLVIAEKFIYSGEYIKANGDWVQSKV